MWQFLINYNGTLYVLIAQFKRAKAKAYRFSADSAQVVIVVVDCKNGFRCSFLQLVFWELLQLLLLLLL
jgi:hypothetical protein